MAWIRVGQWVRREGARVHTSQGRGCWVIHTDPRLRDSPKAPRILGGQRAHDHEGPSREPTSGQGAQPSGLRASHSQGSSSGPMMLLARLPHLPILLRLPANLGLLMGSCSPQPRPLHTASQEDAASSLSDARTAGDPRGGGVLAFLSPTEEWRRFWLL